MSRAEPRLSRSSTARRSWVGALAVAGALLATIALVRIGNPVDAASRAYDAFTAPPPPVEEGLGNRLASASGNGRADFWRIAWDEVDENPVLGGGAGSYERWWFAGRPNAFSARDAHNLYLETLAELGPVGLALVLAALAPPLLALSRSRDPVPTAAGAAYVAFLAHAALDWDWEIVAVTGTALLGGHVVLASARTAGERSLSGRRRAVAVSALVPLVALAAVAHAGNRAAASADRALDRGDAAAALEAADRARRYAPWSTEPLRLRAAARMLSGDPALARTDLRHALRRDPGDWELWFELGFASRGEERRRAFERAIALNPHARDFVPLTR